MTQKNEMGHPQHRLNCPVPGAPAIFNCARAEIAAIASRPLPKAKVVAGKFSNPKAYGSYEELLADPEIEATYIPLSNYMHLEWSIRTGTTASMFFAKSH